ncbi:MAG TPA: hypothetical protein VGB02_06565 [Pyrinomonadaceae bacterium]|jgi:hypothetical protein
MFELKRYLFASILLVMFTAAPVTNVYAGGKEYEAVVKHLKTKYKAKKVKIPMIWLARFAVRMVRPAGVKSFSITTFENLKFSRETLDVEMQMALKNSFSVLWSPIFRVRSRKGEQAYMYAREDGNSVKVMVVTINEDKATVIRAAFSPEKLADFVNDPKIMGISLDDNKHNADNKPTESKETVVTEQKTEELKKPN